MDLKEEQEEFFDVTAQFLSNPDFEEDQTYGTESKVTLNGVVYDPCYVNTVKASDSKWPKSCPSKVGHPATD